MYAKVKHCGYCYKPVSTRLGLCELDQFDCYSESYVKCFWSLCDQQKSVHSFANNPNTKVIMQQPTSEGFKTTSFKTKHFG